MKLKQTVSTILALSLMLAAMEGCTQSTSVTETTTSNIAQGDLTTTDKGGGSKSESTTDTLGSASTISGTVGGDGSFHAWTNNDSSVTPEQMDSMYPTRTGIKGVVKAYTLDDGDDFKASVELFKKTYPDVTDVEVIVSTDGAKNEKLLSLINAGMSPDFVYSTYRDFPLRAAKGLAMPIDKYIHDHPGQSNALMNNNCSYNGQRYCVIIETPVVALYYNTALFQRKGEKTPDEYLAEGNWTWQTLRKVAKKMTDSQNDIYGFATDLDWIFPMSKGQDAIKFENGVAKLNLKGNQEYMNAHQVLVDMINVDKSTYKDSGYASQQFANGKVAMCYESAVAYFCKQTGMKDYKVTLFPKADASSDYYSTVGGVNGGFCIANGSKNIEGGMAFGETYNNYCIAKSGNQTQNPEFVSLCQQYNVKKVVPWFYGFGLDSLYLGNLCAWIRQGTKDINTLIEENAPLMEEKIKEYQ